MKVVEKQRQLLATGSLGSYVSHPTVTLAHTHTEFFLLPLLLLLLLLLFFFFFFFFFFFILLVNISVIKNFLCNRSIAQFVGRQTRQRCLTQDHQVNASISTDASMLNSPVICLSISNRNSFSWSSRVDTPKKSAVHSARFMYRYLRRPVDI